MGTAFVFDPDASYGRVRSIREANTMPAGAHLVAAITGPYKIVSIVDFDRLADLPDLVDGLGGGSGFGDPSTATAVGFAQVKKSVYADQMAFIRIKVDAPNPLGLLEEIREKIGSEEADAVVGDFDILACAAADNEEDLVAKILAVRAIDGVRRTVSLRVIDYVSASSEAPEGHRVPA